MKKILSVTFLAAMIGIAGCDSSDPPPPIPENPTPPPAASQVQVIHAVADAPEVNVNVGGPPPAGSEFAGLAFNGAGIGEFTPGTFDVSVDAVLPDGTTAEVIPATTLDFEEDIRTVIVATGMVGAIEPVVFTQPFGPSTGNARLRVVHAATGVGPVDVYATAPDADLGASAPATTLAFQEASMALDLAPGDYQIRVTPAGDPATVVFDAGTSTITGSEDIVAVAVMNTTASTAPITLIATDATTGDTAVVQDVAAEADLRIVHASPDAGAVDVLANDAVLVPGAVYTNAAEFADLDAGTYDIEIRPAGGDETTTVFQADVDLVGGEYYDAIALGSVNAPVDDPTEFTVLVANDDRRRIATDAKVRLIHGSVIAGEVDVYVVPTGTDITMEDPTAAGVVIGGNSGFLRLAPAVYDIIVTPAGDATMVALGATIDVAGGSISTAVVIDDPDVADTVSALLLDDFTPAPPAP